MYSKYRDYSKKVNRIEFFKAIGAGLGVAAFAIIGYLSTIFIFCL